MQRMELERELQQLQEAVSKRSIEASSAQPLQKHAWMRNSKIPVVSAAVWVVLNAWL
jgi:hypothetical protein